MKKVVDNGEIEVLKCGFTTFGGDMDKYLTDKTKIRERRELKGDRNQCPSCGEFFNSTAAFTKHLVGQVATQERRCMTAEEMVASGMAKNAGGWWVTALMPSNVLQNIVNEEE